MLKIGDRIFCETQHASSRTNIVVSNQHLLIDWESGNIMWEIPVTWLADRCILWSTHVQVTPVYNTYVSHIYIYIYIYICMCIYIYMYVCIYVYIYVYICIYICMCICIYIYTYDIWYMYIRTYVLCVRVYLIFHVSVDSSLTCDVIVFQCISCILVRNPWWAGGHTSRHMSPWASTHNAPSRSCWLQWQGGLGPSAWDYALLASSIAPSSIITSSHHLSASEICVGHQGRRFILGVDWIDADRYWIFVFCIITVDRFPSLYKCMDLLLNQWSGFTKWFGPSCMFANLRSQNHLDFW